MNSKIPFNVIPVHVISAYTYIYRHIYLNKIVHT